MILKIGLKDGEWTVFSDFDRITYKELVPGIDIGLRFNAFDFTWVHKEDVQAAGSTAEKTGGKGYGPQKEIWLYRGDEVKAQIIAYAPIFLLNDNGKTIERI